MKKNILKIMSVLTVLLVTGAVFAQNAKSKIVAGATPVPHAEILGKVKEILAKDGIDLEIKVFTDYVTPNLALADKSIDANYFQHLPYLDDFKKEKKLDLASIAAVHFEPLGVYSKKIKSLKDLKDGDKIAVPNDLTNEARALLLLEANGVITLKDRNNIKSTKKDIVKYAKKIEIVEIEAAQVSRALDSVAAGVINGNYAIEAKLNPAKDAIASEKNDSVAAKTYANILVVRAGDEKRAEILKLANALRSDEVKKFIIEKYKGAVVPVF